MSTVLELKNISKAFGSVKANDRISMCVEKGRTHALLGENGSGKTTLMNILFGLVKRDDGEIFLHGEPAVIQSPLDAIRQGIGMIHQEFMLIPQLTVAENILISVVEKERNCNLAAVQARGEELALNFGLKDKLKTTVEQLSVGERQKVEIIKTLHQGADIIVLDEPTSVLTPQETEYLFELLNNLTITGKTTILITHKLEEVRRYSDDVTILRQGKSIATMHTRDTDKYLLAEMMVGRKMLFALNGKKNKPGDPRIRVEGLSLNDGGREVLSDVSFTVRSGEILGIAGVDGNGQQELGEILAGIRRATRGSYLIEGRPALPGARALADSGVSYIPGERHNLGCASQLSIEENLILKTYNKRSYASRGIMRQNRIRSVADALLGAYQIKAESGGVVVSLLSGGNVQKVILARELSSQPKFLICVQPTRGLDIGAVEYVRNSLLAARDAGVSILLISTELDEIFALSDRIAVLCEGKIAGTLENNPDLDAAQIGLLMAGAAPSERYEAGGTSI
jgi:simple sugar transport system ATP-binding protein